MSDDTQRYLVVGQVLKPWGFHGDLKIKIITDYPNRLLKHKTLYLGPHARAYQVERARLHSGYILVKFVGYDTDTSVAKLRGELVQIPEEAAAKLKKGQYFHHQIIGLTVVTAEGETLGTISQILETGANDVYVVNTPSGKELLLPAIKSVIKKIDLDAKTMTVELIPGLVDL
jgi:16S rRNA processing protein RimM